MVFLGPITDSVVASLYRIVCAVNLQYVKEIFRLVFAFLLLSMLGIILTFRCVIIFMIASRISISLPFRCVNVTLRTFSMIMLYVLAPKWRHQLIGVSLDGASAMTECKRQCDLLGL